MSAVYDRITLRFVCPKCRNKFGKLPRWLKPGGKVTCPKCGDTFVDEGILKAVEALSERCKTK
jgi:predicted nucleic-acid-binding Zn-ribbon protein